jgi:hypothetical protein
MFEALAVAVTPSHSKLALKSVEGTTQIATNVLNATSCHERIWARILRRMKYLPE